MKCSRRVRTVAEAPSLHTYFDVTPESPDGSLVTWFVFDGKPLDAGRVMIGDTSGENAVEVMHCMGNAHSAARQGWLDPEHIFFSAGGQVHIADRRGRVVQRCDGAIDTIHQGSRRGLTHSHCIRRAGGRPPKEEACYRVDIDGGGLVELLDRATAYSFLGERDDLAGVPEECLNFQHTKWAPDGRRWFVVFTNETYRRSHPELPRVKVILAADEDGGNLRLIGSFGHHPNWFPNGSGIYAFADGGEKRLLRWDADGGRPEALAEMPGEGHPSIGPDGRRLVTDCPRWPEPERCSIVLRDLETGRDEVLVEMPFPRVEWQEHHPPQAVCHPHPVWSPDGRRLYFNAVDGELPKLCVMDLNGAS